MARQPQGNEWMGEWNAMGDQFWTALRQGAAQFGGAPAGNPAMQQWQRSFEQAGGAAGGHGEMLQRSMEGMRQYVDFLQNAMQQLGGQGGTTFDPAQLMRGAFRSFDVRQNPVLSALRASAGHGALNVDQLLDGVKQFTEPFRQQMSSGMSMPAFGQHREEVERNQALATALVELQEPMGLYQAEMLQAAKRGLEIFELKLAERSEPGRELSSMRAVYDLWIDAAEEGYAEVALSPGFRKAFGAMANAQMRVRQLIQQQVERSTAALGMPGRTEMDSVLRQLHDVRRRLGDAEEMIASREVGNRSVSTERPAPARAAPARADRPGKVAKTGARVAKKAKRSRKVDRPIAALRNPKAVRAVARQSAAAKVAKPEASKPGKNQKPKKISKAEKSAKSFAERLAATRVPVARKRK